IGLGASDANAYADGTVYSHLDGTSTNTVTATSLAVSAISVEGATANSRASSAGLYGGTDNSATVEVKPTDIAGIESNGTITVTEQLNVLAQDYPEGDGYTHGTAAGFIGTGGSTTT